MSKIHFIKLSSCAGSGKYISVWFRVDLITRFNIGWDNKTHIDYMGRGLSEHPDDYIVKETPEEIMQLIEKL